MINLIHKTLPTKTVIILIKREEGNWGVNQVNGKRLEINEREREGD